MRKTCVSFPSCASKVVPTAKRLNSSSHNRDNFSNASSMGASKPPVPPFWGSVAATKAISWISAFEAPEMPSVLPKSAVRLKDNPGLMRVGSCCCEDTDAAVRKLGSEEVPVVAGRGLTAPAAVPRMWPLYPRRRGGPSAGSAPLAKKLPSESEACSVFEAEGSSQKLMLVLPLLSPVRARRACDEQEEPNPSPSAVSAPGKGMSPIFSSTRRRSVWRPSAVFFKFVFDRSWATGAKTPTCL
mmetsp:Transcript_64378/g.173023  ORF Transcript_64378/g.173023 Transcript_64378/m.173023 type:complete len:242 (+) Transcript_64378:704-1429(+)